MITIDARGLACPQPVLLTQKALAVHAEQEMEVLVDNPTARENVRRFAENAGRQVKISDDAGEFRLAISNGK